MGRIARVSHPKKPSSLDEGAVTNQELEEHLELGGHPQSLQIGDIVQIDPVSDETFGGCLMIVTEPKPWGAQGYVTIPGKGNAFYRCKHENMEKVGHCAWIRNNEDES